jgi:hypothetical protein
MKFFRRGVRRECFSTTGGFGKRGTVAGVPSLGKSGKIFSKAWKIFRETFQGLENFRVSFPFFGNVEAAVTGFRSRRSG